ncbi:hypothetical protein SJI19_11505 [Acerihabitans sp. TG2]|nr:hypothetical protein [Acerihabitans sp. TG2]MEA9391159.1 hypothetical protein [Acerihabitans sp. TG2]
MLWLRFIDGVKLSPQDWQGTGVVFVGMMIMAAGWGKP